jgi:tRNA(His) 5'-end guanylyltransferase
MSLKLTDRIASYATLAQHKLLPKLPVIIVINGRSFSKTTALLDKPYCPRFMEALCATASRLIQDIDGALFAYIFNDEIVIVSRNDQNNDTIPWCDNDIQKIASVVSGIGSLYFNNYAASIDLNVSEAIFTTNVFVVPNITEAINTIIAKQQQNLQNSAQLACFYQLLESGLNKNDIKEMTAGMSREEKIALLLQECKIIFNDYPAAFRYGVACYKKPHIVEYEGKEIIKHKWYLDVDLPLFSQRTLLQDIFKKDKDN